MDKNEQDKIKQTDEYLKLEIAQELGLIDKILEGGWKSLTSKESGRIGGLLSAKKRAAIKHHSYKEEANKLEK